MTSMDSGQSHPSTVAASAVSSTFGLGVARLRLGTLLTSFLGIGTLARTKLARAFLASLASLLLGVLAIPELARVLRIWHDVLLQVVTRKINDAACPHR